MSKHTPGPWQVYHDGFSVAAIDGHLLSTCVEGPTREEARANARLIAAAPDLLEALKDAARDMVRLGFTPAWLDAANAAIAKAEGR